MNIDHCTISWVTIKSIAPISKRHTKRVSPSYLSNFLSYNVRKVKEKIDFILEKLSKDI
jgi:hypothetical protein